MAAPSQLRVLTLHKGEIKDAVIYRLEKGWTLNFVLGTSLTGKNVRIFVNHPLDSKSGPNRAAYRKLEWQNLSSHKSDVYDNFAEVQLIMAGSFNYFFTINGSKNPHDADGRGFFLVDPILRVGKLDDRLPMDCIRCQSILPKFLGPFDQWKARLQVSKESGYNMIHFTPVQELGASNSAYCLKNQLKLNPKFSTSTRTYTMEDLEQLVKMMKDDWGVLSLTDLVFNHTANESPWIEEHPECGYNMINSPHLRPAYLLDRILWHFSLDVGEGKWESEGIPAELRNEDHMMNVRRVLWDKVLPKHRLWEFFQINADDIILKFKSAILSGGRGDDRPNADLVIINDPSYRRLKCTVDIPLAIKNYYSSQPDHISRDERISNACNNLKQKIYSLNDGASAMTYDHLNCAVNSYIANGRWRFINPDGPRIPKVGPVEPIMWNYFTLPRVAMTVEQEEEMMNSPKGAHCMAHNGWVMSDDPLRNFAEPGSNVYLRRELIPWGDNVKLRYGQKYSDCPILWDYTKSYVTETARIFHGVRLDNCHSTPIHVAEFMLDEARKVRPDLYVIAELFTISEYADNTFINRLGLNSLIREGLSAWDPRELGRLVHRFGGSPVGSFIQLPARPLMPTMAHAMFMDQTHDNESPISKHTGFNLLPYSAVIAMACCATGSNRGYDEMVPHYIDVVREKRLYASWTDDTSIKDPQAVHMKTGLISAKKAINLLHHEVGKAGFEQIYVDMVNDKVVSITRHNLISHQSIILIAHTAFSYPHDMNGNLGPISIAGIIDEIIFEARLSKKENVPFNKHNKFINGLSDYYVTKKEHIKVANSEVMQLVDTGDKDSQSILFHNFPPGSAIALKVSLPPHARSGLLAVRHLLAQFGYRMRTFSARTVEEIKGGDLENSLADLSLNDLNRVLYRCDYEEKDDGKGFGVYDLPNFGPLLYCGLQGVATVLNKIRAPNDLGHPLCENLRKGDWLMHYTANRLIAHENTLKIGVWLQSAFNQLARAPRYLIPCYFDALVTGVYSLAEEICWAKMSEFISNGSTFVRALSWTSVQLCSYVKSSKLPKLSKNLGPPLPPKAIENKQEVETCVSMSAGLPHFSAGLFRNWGRDTFIALRGLLLVTGRYAEACFIILTYANTLRHGLIPNLLGEGTFARFNCRDAVWFWLQCIKDYVAMAPNGKNILKDKVARLYPKDDSPATFDFDQPLYDTIQEAMQKHADGVAFRERNAGYNLDMQMVDNGFNNQIGVDWTTGFVYGGNSDNCGTWMDKMGSSEKAGNKGRPATPRDGSAVEIVGLSASVLSWLVELKATNDYPYEGVNRRGLGPITFKQWYQMIVTNFEKHYWIDPTSNGIHKAELINQRAIYKDTLNSQLPYTDYQFRRGTLHNYVTLGGGWAPNIFNAEHAWKALKRAEECLLGPLGMKTLDASDWNYNGNYFNNDDSDDSKRAKGFNYHNGPEWVWPVGFFFRAKLFIAAQLEPKKPGIFKETVNFIKQRMCAHNIHVHENDWKSLPELTNQNGAYCPDSCQSQAWSSGCLLEVLYDMEHLYKTV